MTPLRLEGTHIPYSSMPSGDGEHRGKTSSKNGLPGSMFANPLDPNIIVQPKKKAPKKGKHRNALKTQGDVPLTSNATYRPQLRARKLKAEFPSKATEIPDAVTKQASRNLLERFKAVGLAPIKTNQGSMMAKQRKAIKDVSEQVKSASHKSKRAEEVQAMPPPRPNAKPKLKPKTRLVSKSRKPPPSTHGVSEARLAETARNIGNATSFPIIID